MTNTTKSHQFLIGKEKHRAVVETFVREYQHGVLPDTPLDQLCESIQIITGQETRVPKIKSSTGSWLKRQYHICMEFINRPLTVKEVMS